jgi:nitrogen regulatory protein PII 2
MKEVMAVIRMNKINETKRALNAVGITSFSATGRVLGRGKGLVDFCIIHGAEDGYNEAITRLGDGPRLIPQRLVSIVVSDDWVERTVKAILETNRTGNGGDGKIFVLPVLEASRVRTGETVAGACGGNVLDSSGGLE